MTSSLCCGSKTSNAFGNSVFGNWNNFKFPFPDAVTTKSKDSPAFSFVFDALTLKSKVPTAPVKFSGFPFSGKAFTLIDLAPAETVFLVVSYDIVSIKPMRFLVGTSTSKTIESGSNGLFPASNGYKITFRQTTMA